MNTAYKILLFTLLLTACSSTSSLHEDETLYIGMRKTNYEHYEACPHFTETKDELEVALACPPNGALLGSPYYRMPFTYGLWIWNAFSDSDSGFSKWMKSSFGRSPILLSDANPELRVTVAETVLKNNGYFRGNVSYKLIESGVGTTRHDSVPRPRKAKVAYNVSLGTLFTLDSISYTGFSDEEMRIIKQSESLLHKGDAFSIATLDEERTRIFKALREYGYYFYRQDYCTYLADTMKVKGKVQLQLHKTDSLPEEAYRKWVIGKTQYRIRREIGEQLTDTVSRRFLTVNYGGKKPPLRTRVLLPDIRLRPGDLFAQSELEESTMRLGSKGVFSSVDISFSPHLNPDGTIKTLSDTLRQTTRNGKDRKGAGVLDMVVDCTLDKPFDLSIEGNYMQKSSGRGGPGVGLSFAKRNAFRGGEILSFNLGASLDFAFNKATNDAVNYDIVGDITLEMPRMLLPNFIKPNRRWYSMPTTLLRVSSESINRTGYYRRNIFSAELVYSFRPKETVRHTFTPLKIDYSYVASHTAEFDSIASRSSYMMVLLADNFVPKMRYTFDYSSDAKHRNPITLSVSVTEAGNITNLMLMAAGKGGWNTRDKKMFGVNVAQFLKTEIDWRKLWTIGEKSSLVAHAYGGYIYSYGNSLVAPTTEMFYMGGANDLRGFSTRSVGPGDCHFKDQNEQYVKALGDMKLLGNIEYRPHIIGSLYGALFLDAGNCWNQHPDKMPDVNDIQDSRFNLKNLYKDIAVNAGVGIRYDLDFFVLRLDWGFIVHAPYDTGRGGYFNTPSRFSQMQCLNFAIGYPF